MSRGSRWTGVLRCRPTDADQARPRPVEIGRSALHSLEMTSGGPRSLGDGPREITLVKWWHAACITGSDG